MKHRMPAHRGHLPIPGRERIVIAAGRDRRVEDERAVRALRAQRRVALRDLNRDLARGRIRRRLCVGIEWRHRGHLHLLAGAELRPRIHLLQQRRADVKPLTEFLERIPVRHRRQQRLFVQVAWNHFLERPLHIVRRDRVGDAGGPGAVAAERAPRLAIGLTRRRKLTRILQRGERPRHVDAQRAIDLARGEALSIEQHLKRKRAAARRGHRHWLRGRTMALRWQHERQNGEERRAQA